MRTYLEITISGNQQQRELLIPTMMELGCQGFQETDSELFCYVDRSRWTDESLKSFQTQLKTILQIISVNADVRFREIVDQDWNEQWEKSIQPIEIGKRLVIKPSWREYENQGNRIIIQIDPKMAFGTGYHETTRLTLRLVESYTRRGCRVLDVGTGTGILAIASVKLGAASAIGIDNDEWAIENAQENVKVNGVTRQIEISDRLLSTLPSSSIDLLTANLTLNTNIEMLGEFQRILKSGGVLILSGFLVADRDTMRTHLSKTRFDMLEELTENEWNAIAARKKQ